MNTTKEQEEFIRSLDKRLSPETKTRYKKRLGMFLNWLNTKNKKLRTVKYNDLLSFVRHCKKQNMSTDQVNRTIHILQQYFAIKQKAGIIKRNPVIGLKVRGSKSKLPKDILDRQALDKLYEYYPSGTPDNKRNKVMLGLLINQGVTTGDLRRLKTEHVKLREGKIYLPSGVKASRKTISSRTLELKASQILELKEYIEHVRPLLNKKGSEHLFMSLEGTNDAYSINNAVSWMSRKIRKYAKHYRNVKQIRASVIAEWLKEKDVRQVQYMAGHVCVTSTEWYKAVRLEDLQEALDQYHPLK